MVTYAQLALLVGCEAVGEGMEWLIGRTVAHRTPLFSTAFVQSPPISEIRGLALNLGFAKSAPAVAVAIVRH